MEENLEEIRRELVNGYAKKGHPFRYFSLATLSGDKPVQRTVVLRKLLPDFKLMLYTDARSNKINQITTNTQVSTLFYHPKKLLQIQLTGHAERIEGEALDIHWKTISENARKDYTTSEAPGTPIKNLEDLQYRMNSLNFAMIQIIPDQIDYLQLKRPNHLRIRFTKQDNDWLGQYLVP